MQPLSPRPPLRTVALAFGLAGLLALVSVHLLIRSTRDQDYNAVRLQRSFVLAAGKPLYAGPHSGAILDVIYGPVGAVAYLPATLWRSPAPAVLAGQVLSWLYVLLPLAWLHFRSRAARRRSLWDLFGFLTCVALICDARPLEYVAFSIHVDAPALALGILAAAVAAPGEPGSTRRDLLSALLAVLAVWTKLMMLPLLVVLPAGLWLTRGRRHARRYLACLIPAALAISALMLAFASPADLWFNIWTVPARHTLEGDRSSPLFWGRGLAYLLWENAGIWMLWLLAVFLRFCRRREGRQHDPAVTFGLVGLSLVPMAVLGILKVGGDINALSYVSYFLLAGSTRSLAEQARRRKTARIVLLASPVLVTLLLLVTQASEILRDVKEPVSMAGLPHQLAYEYARRHPGEVWFPRITLANFLAEGKIYHQSTGLVNRLEANVPPGDEQLRAHVPAGMKAIACWENSYVYQVFRAGFDEYSESTRDPELPGFVVFRKPPAEEGGAPGSHPGFPVGTPGAAAPSDRANQDGAREEQLESLPLTVLL